MEKVTVRLWKCRNQIIVNSLITDAPWCGPLEGRADAVHKAVRHLRMRDDLKASG